MTFIASFWYSYGGDELTAPASTWDWESFWISFLVFSALSLLLLLAASTTR